MTGPVRLPLPTRLRTVFVSDLHLGSSNCHAHALAAFLREVECERLYLVGDVIDLWWMSERRASWHHDHTRVFERLHAMARAGTEIVYIPGNHDRPLRQFCGLMLPRMRVRRRVIHRTADGRRLLVTHGDEFDAITQFGDWHEWLGDRIYTLILAGNRWTNWMRRRLGLRYWSLAEFLKRRSGAAERYIARFVHACVADARGRGLDGIVCGHIHRPALCNVDGVLYANDGDWVESLSALTEDADGTLRLVHWSGRIEQRELLPPRLVLAPLDAAALLPRGRVHRVVG